MIKYTTLEIEDNKIKVRFEVEDKSYYEDVYLGGISIDIPMTYDTEEVYYRNIYKPITFPEKPELKYPKTLYYEIPIAGSSKELFIITPIIHGAPSPTAPCGADVIDKAVIYDKSVIYDKGMGYVNELGNTCNIPRYFVDFILRKYAFEMAVETCNYDIAVKYWKMLTMNKGTTVKKGCGCNGQ